MLRLRPYKKCDAQSIVKWIDSEYTFRLWSADRYKCYPITADDINYKYFEQNGDCSPDNFYPFTAFDNNGLVGHLILRFLDEQKKNLHIGFVIINSELRAKGFGKQLIKLALEYSFNILKAQTVNLGVYEKNTAAIRCYQQVGFELSGNFESSFIDGKEWKFLEMVAYPNKSS